MLIATQGQSVAATQQYFQQVLCLGDYYLGQEVAGHWHGKGAEVLGLGQGSKVTAEQFRYFLHGHHPVTGNQLTQRQRADRRPGVDLTFSVPKSVSLAWAINDDERIVELLRQTVQETMSKDIEPLMQRRVRTGEKAYTKERTPTSKLIYADFLHKTSRPVDGKPDPHLHIHAFVINWTEHHFKHYAGEFEEIIRQRPSLQAKFEARLARKLQRELGYQIEKVSYEQSGQRKTGWEIAGITRQTIEKFSQRTEQVEAYAAEHGITDAFAKAKLGVKTREKKDTGLTIDQLRHEWRSRLTQEERESFRRVKDSRAIDRELANEHTVAREALNYALEHHLYRNSTVERQQIMGTALEQAVTVAPEQMEQAFDQLPVIRKLRNVEGAPREFVTTKEVLNAENEIIMFARDGRGTRKALGNEAYRFQRDWLNEQQKEAVNHILTSRDAVMAVLGGAGTGKSSLLQEVADALQRNGKQLFTFAPSTGAREVLEGKGFSQAQTVEHLLRNEQLQKQISGQLLWIDEAGLLDVRAMQGIFRVAKEQNARVVLSGDTRQHSAPRRGEALRLLEKEAGLKIARVETIQRQRGTYKEAVALISKGQEIVEQRSGKTGLLAGFDLLDELGKIQEVSGEQRTSLLAQKYLHSQAQGKSTLIVAPTHREAREVTSTIREQLKENGLLNREEFSLLQLRSLNWTDAEKRNPSSYHGQENLVVQFHQNVKGGFQRGQRYRVTGVDGQGISLVPQAGGPTQHLPQSAADRFEVYRSSTVSLSVGDQVRFSLGGTAIDQKRRIANGRLDEISGFDRQGNLRLKSGLLIPRDFGHLDYGYVITSHASQGKDRDVAIAAMGSDSLPAINAQQFYVTVSRGKEDVMIYVDDKARVRQAIARSGAQLSATELVQESAYENVWDRPSSRSSRGHDLSAGRGWPNVKDRFVAWWRDRVTSGFDRALNTHEPASGRERSMTWGPSPSYGKS